MRSSSGKNNEICNRFSWYTGRKKKCSVYAIHSSEAHRLDHGTFHVLIQLSFCLSRYMKGSKAWFLAWVWTTSEIRLKLVRFSRRRMVVLLHLDLGTRVCAKEILLKFPSCLGSQYASTAICRHHIQVPTTGMLATKRHAYSCTRSVRLHKVHAETKYHYGDGVVSTVQTVRLMVVLPDGGLHTGSVLLWSG